MPFSSKSAFRGLLTDSIITSHMFRVWSEEKYVGKLGLGEAQPPPPETTSLPQTGTGIGVLYCCFGHRAVAVEAYLSVVFCRPIVDRPILVQMIALRLSTCN